MAHLLDTQAYFDRIGYSGESAPTLAVLQELHARHVEAIPFENLSPLLGLPVPLDLASLQRKLVEERRGGYCFEQNMLFRAVLRELGFEVEGLAARVRWQLPSEAIETPRSHMLLRVEVDGQSWLADVGFGGLTQTAALRFEPGVTQAMPHEPFRVRAVTDALYRTEAQVAGQWQTLYEFDLRPQQDIDYEVANWYVATHPASRFVNGLLAARVEGNSRHTLANGRYSAYREGVPSKRCEVGSATELVALLREAFGIAVPEHPQLMSRLAPLLTHSATP